MKDYFDYLLDIEVLNENERKRIVKGNKDSLVTELLKVINIDEKVLSDKDSWKSILREVKIKIVL